PVYFQGKLAGAIAYGLAGGGSTLAGLTPAEDMAALLGSGAEAGAAARLKVPRGLAARMAEETGRSITQTGTMTRLRTPLSASGLTDRGLRRMQAAIDRQGLPFVAYMGSSAPIAPPPSSGRLRAGDSFAAAMSVGDVTVAGVGTTTLVCNGQVVAFGHPFNWSGDTTMSIHAADTITIVEDPIFGSYKLANIAESVGTLTHDRLAGVVGVLGAPPAGSPISSTVTDLDTGRTRTGRSDAIFPDFMPFLAYSHLFQNIDVTIDRIGPGSSAISYTIRGTRDRGATWALTRSTRYASPFDISFESVFEVAITAEVLQGFEDEDIEVTSIDVPKLDVTETFERYELRRLLVWNGSRYVRKNYATAGAGERIRLRAVLRPVHRTGTKNIDLSLRVPAGARRSGYIEVFGGGAGIFEDPCFLFPEECAEDTTQSFDQVLRAFRNQPAGDELVARLWLRRSERPRAQAVVRQDSVVAGGAAIGFLLEK
ncbi:MAG: hypothetical protein ACRDT9_14885, partial [Agromyces sp.]